MGKVMFSVWPHLWGSYLGQVQMVGGGGGCPSQVQMGGGYPSQVWQGCTLAMCDGWGGVAWPDLTGGYPSRDGVLPSQVRIEGTPQQGWGTPPASQVRTEGTPARSRRGTPAWGTPPPPRDRTAHGVFDRRSVCLLRSRRRTFLLLLSSEVFKWNKRIVRRQLALHVREKFEITCRSQLFLSLGLWTESDVSCYCVQYVRRAGAAPGKILLSVRLVLLLRVLYVST